MSEFRCFCYLDAMQENDSCVASLLSDCSVPESDRKSNDKNYEVKNLNDKLHAVMIGPILLFCLLRASHTDMIMLHVCRCSNQTKN